MDQVSTSLVPYDALLPAEVSGAERYLVRIRPEWQATPLVRRVKALLPVDPSSACQRLLNAATHDLRAKIRILGIDLAHEVAQSSKLPPLPNDEALEDYPTARLYDLAHRMGLLNRAEWRRLHRAYEIRRDLEHEDDEYEASFADLIYIFETAIDVVLTREPTQVIRLQEIEEVVQSDSPILISQDLVDDYEQAPAQRQAEILQSLSFWALDDGRPELVRLNCFRLLRQLAAIAPARSKIDLAKKLELRIGRRSADLETAQVAIASGAFPFMSKRQQRALVDAFLRRFDEVKPDWRQHPYHSELLNDFVEVGGLAVCPPGAERRVLRWMIRAYVGEPGKYGTFGRNRAVFFSDTAAHRILDLLRSAPPALKAHITYVSRESEIRQLVQIPEQASRLETLVNVTSAGVG